MKFNNPKSKNSVTMETELLIAKLINDAQSDTTIKAILLHGGKFYSSGNDITVLA